MRNNNTISKYECNKTVVFFIETKNALSYEIGTLFEYSYGKYYINGPKENLYVIPEEQINAIPSFVLFLKFVQEYKCAFPETKDSMLSAFEEKLKIYFEDDIVDINATDVKGNTILHLIEILKYPELVLMALNAGAIEKQNSEGHSPWVIAKNNGFHKTAELLSTTEEEKIRITGTLDEWLNFIKTEFFALRSYDNKEYFDKIFNRINELNDEIGVLKCLDTFICCDKHEQEMAKRIFGVLGTTKSISTKCQEYCDKLMQIGISAYKSGKFKFAEKVFHMVSNDDCNNYGARVYYAHMLRRGECQNFNGDSAVEALRLLQPIAEDEVTFAIVNLALTYALCFGSEADWQLADNLMSSLPQYKSTNDIMGILEQCVNEKPDDIASTLERCKLKYVLNDWRDIAKQGDIEGDLVHYFLLRHNKIDESELGSLKSLSRRIRKNIPGIPDWICEDSDFDSLDDIFDAFDDVDFFELLDEYLNTMPRNRNSVDEILEKIEIFDILDLYQTVLDYDFRVFLTNEELHKLVKDYKDKFSVELPFDIDGI